MAVGYRNICPLFLLLLLLQSMVIHCPIIYGVPGVCEVSVSTKIQFGVCEVSVSTKTQFDQNHWDGETPCKNLQTVYKPEHWIPLLSNPCSNLSGPRCDKTSRKHVAIVGAGMAGLTMAWVLKAIGHKVTLVEAENRIGGRVETVYKNGWYGDMGAMRFKSKKMQPLTFATIEKFIGRKEMKPFIEVTKYIFLDGKYFSYEKIENEDAETMKNLYKLFGLRNTENMYKCLNKNLNKTVSFNAETMFQNPLNIFGSIVKRYSNIEYKKQCELRLSIKKYMENEIQNSCDIDHDQLKAIQLYWGFMDLRFFTPITMLKIPSWSSFDESLQLLKKPFIDYNEMEKIEETSYEIVNGTIRLPNAILNHIKEDFDKDFHIILNKTVQSVVDEGNGVRMIIDDKNSIRSDYIFMTPTARAVSNINFDPRLPLNKKLALEDTHYTSAIKVFLNFDFPFWQYPGNGKVKMSIPFNSRASNGGVFLTDLTMKRAFYPSHSYHGSSILASYMLADDAEKLASFSDEQIVNLALDTLEVLHGDDVRKHFKGGKENYAVKKWMNDKNNQGAFVLAYPGQIPDLHFLLKAPLYDGRLQFGGEYAGATYTGWIEPSIESAFYAAHQMFGNNVYLSNLDINKNV